MTFTYDLSTDIGMVRLRVADRVQKTDTGTPATESGIRSDEEIQNWIDYEGSWEAACIAWVQSVLNELAQEPDSKADWLEIELDTAVGNYQAMLDELKEWLDVPDASTQNRTAVTVKLWRSDTEQTNPN